MYLSCTHFRQLTSNKVAASCKHYAECVTFPLQKGTGTFAEELKWSYTYLQNNVEPRIYELVQATFASFEPLEQGDHLFLKLSLDHLVLSNDANEAALVDAVFNYTIKTNSKTENVLEVSQNLSAITYNIMPVQDHKENPFSDDYVQRITGIYQTTGVEEFNRTFAKLEADITYSSSHFRKVTVTVSLWSHKTVSSSLSTHITMDNIPEYCKNKSPQPMKPIASFYIRKFRTLIFVPT